MEQWHITGSCSHDTSGLKSQGRPLTALQYQKGGVSDSIGMRYCSSTGSILRGLVEWITTATLPYVCPRKICCIHKLCVAKCMVSLQHFIQGFLRNPNDLDPKKDVLYKMHQFIETGQSQHSILLCTEECERRDNLE